jgi:oligogalacturonide lyase
MSVTRRNFALSLAAAATAQAQFTPIRRYLDPSTEVEVHALSDPSNASYMPHHYNRSISSRNGFLVYATETTQGFQAVRLDIKGGATRVLTSATGMDPKSLALSPDDRTLYFADGDRLLATSMGGGKPRELYKAASPKAFNKGISLSDDGASITIVDGAKLMLIPTASSARAATRVLAEIDPTSEQAAVSRTGTIFYRDKTKSIFLTTTAPGSKPARLPIEGDLGPAVWNPDGRSLLYLKVNQGKGIANAVFEYSLDTKEETLVGKTSQFVHFGRNADSSVFVGASGSKAQPYILIMLRITRRELALCEHKSSDPTSVAPVFSPNSQRIYFQSDRLGKQAIFSVAVERLVEKTEQEEKPEKKT